MEVDLSLTDEFLAEARDHLESVESLLPSLEGCKPGPESAIDKLFRSIHSMKGAAGVLGFKAVANLLHAMESLLSKIRSGELVATRLHVDLLMEGSDMLNAMVANLDKAGEIPSAALIEKLNAATGSTKAAKTPAQLSAAGIFHLTDEIRAAARKGSDCFYEIIVKESGAQLEKVVEELKSYGEILKRQESDGLCHLLYATILGADLINDAIPSSAKCVVALKGTQSAPKPPPPKIDSHGEERKKPETPPSQPVATGESGQEHKKAVETVRINVEALDRLMALASELVLVRNKQMQWYDRKDPVASEIARRFNAVTSELQGYVMGMRMQPIGNVFGKLPRLARDLGRRLAKQVELDCAGSEVEVDKTILESLSDPLSHIIRNCCDHGIEPADERLKAGKSPHGNIKVEAVHEGGQIIVRVSDDGRGMDPEKLKAKALEKRLKTKEELDALSPKQLLGLVMLPGFSTAAVVSDISGRGVGMDVVRTSIERLGGSIDIESSKGHGTTLTLSLPLTLAIMPCLLVSACGNRFAIPQANLEEVLCLFDGEIDERLKIINHQEMFNYHGKMIQLARLEEALASPKALDDDRRHEIAHRKEKERAAAKTAKASLGLMDIAIVKVGAKRYGLAVRSILGPEEIVVKPMHPALKGLKCFLGATVLGDGSVSLILDIDGLGRHALGQIHSPNNAKETQVAEMLQARSSEGQKVLLFRSGGKEQFAISLALIKRVDWIKTAGIESIGKRQFIGIDGAPVRILKLEEALEVSPCEMRDEMFLILPKHMKRPFGILSSGFSEICETIINFNHQNGVVEDGILGTAWINGKLTIFPDLYRLIEKVEPGWFETEGKKLPAKSHEGVRILLAEDTPFFRQLVKKYLESDRYVVETAANGREAIEKLDHGEFDILLSDLEMPVMNGWQLVETLNADPKRKPIPAIALTSLDSETDRKSALKSGFRDYIVKIERETFLNRIANFVAVWRSK